MMCDHEKAGRSALRPQTCEQRTRQLSLRLASPFHSPAVTADHTTGN